MFPPLGENTKKNIKMINLQFSFSERRSERFENGKAKRIFQKENTFKTVQVIISFFFDNCTVIK